MKSLHQESDSVQAVERMTERGQNGSSGREERSLQKEKGRTETLNSGRNMINERRQAPKVKSQQKKGGERTRIRRRRRIKQGEKEIGTEHFNGVWSSLGKE